MAVRAEGKRTGRFDLLPVVAVIIAGFLLSVSVLFIVRGYYAGVARQQFQRNATYYGTTFKNAVERHVTSLAAIHAFVSASHDVNRWEFSAFARQTLPQNSGFKAVLWLPALTQKERAGFEARLQKDGLYGLRLRELTKEGALVKAGPRASYLPVAYVEPFEGNGGLIGVDLANDSIYAPLFRNAQKTGRVAASTPSTQALVEGARLPIVLVAFPLIRTPVDPAKPADPRPDGYALGVLQLDRVIDDAIGAEAPIEAAIAYGGVNGQAVYVAGERTRTVPLEDWFGRAANRQIAPFDVAGQKFMLVMRSPRGTDVLTQFYAPFGAALLVLAVTALLAQSMASTVFQKRHVEQAVIARTKELQTEVSHRHEAEIELIRERDRAESANRAKSVFLSTMSHELRTPLNAIIGFSSILSGPGPIPEDRAQDYAREINNGGSKLLDLINDILDITQMDAEDSGAGDEFDIGELVESLLVKLAPEANQAGIRLECTMPSGLPYLSGDRRRIAKALQHLLGNAVKFGRKDGFARIAVCADEAGLAIAITDNGVGMPPGAEARIVHLFAQADSALGRHHEGIGLGLTFVRRVADQHGARLEIKSRLGEGTEVTLLFPLARLVPAVPVKEVA